MKIIDLDLSKLKLGDKLTIDVRVRFIDIGSDLPLCVDIGDVDDFWLSPTCIQSCNARLTDHIGDATEKITDHISDPQEKVKPLEFEGVRIATLTAERDAALARLADIVTTLEARYDWSKMPLDDPLGVLLRQFDTDGVWIGEVEG